MTQSSSETAGVDCYAMQNMYKAQDDSFGSQIVRAIMAFVMGAITIIRLSRAVPGRLMDVSLYSSDVHPAHPMLKGQQFGLSPLSAPECFAIIKHMAIVEDKVNMLSSKQAAMCAEKDEMLNAAVSRVSALEEDLAATKKVCSNLIYFHFLLLMRSSIFSEPYI